MNTILFIIFCYWVLSGIGLWIWFFQEEIKNFKHYPRDITVKDLFKFIGYSIAVFIAAGFVPIFWIHDNFGNLVTKVGDIKIWKKK